jgi:hypothetical protein
MSKKNKILPYVIFGVPLLVGGFFLYKYIKSKKTNNGDVNEPNTPNIPNPTTTGSGTTKPTEYNKLPFKKGMRDSYYIVNIQRKLGISDDGIFGSKTDASVRAFQKSKGLVSDGIVGAKTWKALFGIDFPLISTNINEQPSRIGVNVLPQPTNSADKPFLLGGSNWM